MREEGAGAGAEKLERNEQSIMIQPATGLNLRAKREA